MVVVDVVYVFFKFPFVPSRILILDLKDEPT